MRQSATTHIRDLVRRCALWPIRLCVATAATVLPACEPADADPRTTIVHDSAGIHVVQNSGDGAWPLGQGWEVTEAITIGSANGPPEHALKRATTVAAGADGRVYVLDADDRNIKVYNAEGRFIEAIGRGGRNQGEFQVPARIALRADTLFVLDTRFQQLAVFAPDGMFLRTDPVALHPKRHGIATQLEPISGGFAVVLADGCSPSARDGSRSASWKLVTINDQGDVDESVSAPLAGYALAADGDRFCAAPDDRHHGLAIAPDGLAAYGDGVDYEIRMFRVAADEPGTARPLREPMPPPHRIVRRSTPPLRYTPSEPSMPRFFDALHWDHDGFLWVGRPVDGGASSKSWDVFDPAGQYLGDVQLPADLTVHAITHDTIWGTSAEAPNANVVKGFHLRK